ncbi:MAG: vitamin K epoxide reductase family protein [Patescibacteria group bacterium]
MFSKKLSIIWIVFALIGFVDALYLTVGHYQGEISCSVIQGCDVVLASSYATVGPVPMALLGVGYYLSMLLGMIFVLDRQSQKVGRLLTYISVVGFVYSLWLLYLQWGIIEAFCQYCLISAGSSTALFILGVTALINKSKASATNP